MKNPSVSKLRNVGPLGKKFRLEKSRQHRPAVASIQLLWQQQGLLTRADEGEELGPVSRRPRSREKRELAGGGGGGEMGTVSAW